jgi:predicted 3-demethylubiquinone-9 3-methyltransferase (glyoxalase superfamily)
VGINGGPEFSFTEAVSFMINCETQDEVDHYWEKLTDGGEPVQCGWLKDRFGLSWQVVPKVLGELLADEDPGKAKRVTEAMLKMVKLDIAGLQAAYEGKS